MSHVTLSTYHKAATVQKTTILVVDDEPSIVGLVERILRGAGYRVLSASDPTVALQICRKHGKNIALALLDHVMPKLSGPELA
jgi:CheY-like chemotaxis protein